MNMCVKTKGTKWLVRDERDFEEWIVESKAEAIALAIKVYLSAMGPQDELCGSSDWTPVAIKADLEALYEDQYIEDIVFIEPVNIVDMEGVLNNVTD